MPNQSVEWQSSPQAAKAYKGLAMEGIIARWYSTNRANDPELGPLIDELTDYLAPGSHVLEVAPGPGYLAIELAKRGLYRVVGLDISATFVQIARAKAKEADVAVEFQQGNASRMPFAESTFDFVVCRAAFKNFTEPARAIEEMHRVLKPGGSACIIDLRGDATKSDIRAAVEQMGLGTVNQALTRLALSTFLLKNAYTTASMRQLVAQTSFKSCDIREDSIGMQVWLEK